PASCLSGKIFTLPVATSSRDFCCSCHDSPRARETKPKVHCPPEGRVTSTPFPPDDLASKSKRLKNSWHLIRVATTFVITSSAIGFSPSFCFVISATLAISWSYWQSWELLDSDSSGPL